MIIILIILLTYTLEKIIYKYGDNKHNTLKKIIIIIKYIMINNNTNNI